MQSIVLHLLERDLAGPCRASGSRKLAIAFGEATPPTHLLSSPVQLSTTVIGETAASVTSFTRKRWPSREGT